MQTVVLFICFCYDTSITLAVEVALTCLLLRCALMFTAHQQVFQRLRKFVASMALTLPLQVLDSVRRCYCSIQAGPSNVANDALFDTIIAQV